MFTKLIHRGAAAIGGAALGVLLLGGGALAWTGHVGSQSATDLAGHADGYYVWHNKDGMHLRTTDNKGVFVYDGTLHTDGTFYDVNAVRLEKDDEVTLVDEHTLHYHFVTAEGIDGFDFRVKKGAELTFDLKKGDDEISTSEIYLGAKGIHPKTDPFTLHRKHHRTTSTTAASART